MQILDHVIEIATKQRQFILIIIKRKAYSQISLGHFMRECTIGSHNLLKVLLGHLGSAGGAKLFIGTLLLYDLRTDRIRHLIEGQCQSAELVVAKEIYPGCQITICQTAGSLSESRD